MDTKEFNHFKLEVAYAHCDLEQSVQDAMGTFNHQMDVIMDRQEYKSDDSNDVEKNGNILAVPNSDYIYNEIVKQVNSGRGLVNLNYDSRLRRSGYTTALRDVAYRFRNERVVVIGGHYQILSHLSDQISGARFYSVDKLGGLNGLRPNDMVLVDNSVKELTSKAKEELEGVINGFGTVVTFSDLGLEEDMPF